VAVQIQEIQSQQIRGGQVCRQAVKEIRHRLGHEGRFVAAIGSEQPQKDLHGRRYLCGLVDTAQGHPAGFV
jgi:hypothetical protein